MKTLLSIALAWAILSICACTSEGSDPLTADTGITVFGGSLNERPGMANVPAGIDNQYDICADVFEQLYNSYLYVFGQAATASEASTIRILGNNSGFALVRAQPVEYNQLPGSNVQFNTVATFHDYSSNGKLFLGGTIAFSGRWNDTDGTVLPFRIYLDGGLQFNGSYSGLIEFLDFLLGTNRDGTLTTVGIPPTETALGGTVKIISRGDTLEVEPYPQDPY